MSSVMVPFVNLSSKIEILQDEQDPPWINRADFGGCINLPQIKNSIPDEMKQHEVRTREKLIARSISGL